MGTKLNWNGYFLVIAMCTTAGMSNQSMTLLLGAFFGFFLGCIFGLPFLLW